MRLFPTLDPDGAREFSALAHPWLAGCFAASISLLQIAHARAAQSVLLTCCALGFVGTVSWQRLRLTLPQPLTAALCEWVAVAGLSCLWSAQPATSFGLFATNVLLPAVCFLLAIGLSSSLRYRQAFALALLVGLAWAGTATFSALLAGRVDILASGRARDLGAHYLMRWYPGPGLWSTFSLLALPMLYWAHSERLWPRALLGGATAWTLLAGAVTYNRMYWPALLCAVAVMVAMYASVRFRLLRGWRGAALFLATALLAVVLVTATTALRREGHLNAPSVARAAGRLVQDARIGIWQTWVLAGAEHPVLGTGFGKDVARSLYAPQLEAAIGGGMTRMGRAHPHNLLLSTWVQTGVVGLIAFLALAWATVRHALDAFRRGGLSAHVGVALLTLLLILFVKNATDDFYDRTVAVLFWSYAGMLVGRAGELARSESNPPQEV